MRRRLVHAGAGVVIAGHLAGAVAGAAAQERPRPVVEVSGGWMGFADDAVVSETPVGLAARWYFRPRVAIGPEVLFIQGDGHTHVAITGNLTWDLLSDDRKPGRITPFLVAGVGLFQTRQTFFGDTFSSSEGAFTAGGGLRTHVSDRLTVGVDARVGWELHLRVGGFVGIALGR